MSNEDGESYLKNLEESDDPNDRETAERIKQAQEIGVGKSPLDKIPDTDHPVVETTMHPIVKRPRKGPY
ncbi:MAG TPA: hypothetical protein VI795_03835 [Patescibacteria group bacterium]|nr:hypothetical protein [Patescibacteria group bacterium]